MKNIIKILGLLPVLLLCCFAAYASNTEEQHRTVAIAKKTENFINEKGIDKAIIEFKNSKDIVIGNYDGVFFVSPLHPELIGKSLLNYKDASGALVVQEEVDKAKSGGGWLKGRWRYNSLTKTYQCRKIYILPVSGNYYIGSWYHYSTDKKGTCSV